jgi:hypothetical protein
MYRSLGLIRVLVLNTGLVSFSFSFSSDLHFTLPTAPHMSLPHSVTWFVVGGGEGYRLADNHTEGERTTKKWEADEHAKR